MVAVPAGLPKTTAVAIGRWFALACGSNGKVAAWGDNANGQLDVPKSLKDVRLITAGTSFGVAVYGSARSRSASSAGSILPPERTATRAPAGS